MSTAGVYFPDCLILDARFASSKAGNPYCSLQFLANDSLSVYSVMLFGDAVGVAAGLTRGARVSLGFSVLPDRNGGVRLELVSMGAVESV